MPKNVMKLLKRSANHSRNAFDLSHRHLLSANFGELLPVTCIETVPGDYIELHISDLLRALPMITSPFMRVKQHFDVWFTPYEDLWSNFEPFMVQKFEPKHGNNLGGFQFCPSAYKSDFYDAISYATTNSLKDVIGRDFSKGARKLLDYLGYGLSPLDDALTSENSPKVNLWRLAQYNKIWYEEYRQQYYDNGLRFMSDEDFKSGHNNPAVMFNFDDLPCYNAASADIVNAASATINAGDSMTKRLAEMLQMRYRCWKKDLFTGLMPSTQFGNVSQSRLQLDSFGYFNYFGLGVFNQNTPNTAPNIRALSPNTDQFTAYGNIAARGVGIAENSDSLNSIHNDTKFFMRNSVGDPINPLTIAKDDNGQLIAPRFNILDLRKAEAVQIWREAALTAGNRVSDNLRAHYGDDVDYNEHRSTFLGSVDAPFNISDVNATAETGSSVNGVLGDVAGKGISSLDEKVFKFKAKKFGCIMVMFSLLPEAEYESYGIDRMNQLLESEDYFINEYQDLGLEAVSSLNFVSAQVNASKVLGYAPRYYGYKQKLDKCFGDFRNGGIFAPWASPKIDVFSVLSGDYAAMPLSLLYVNPNLFNQNFAVSTENSDQVICDIYFDCNAVRQMSITGLPKF